MLNLSSHIFANNDNAEILANWEEDIKHVGIEPCDLNEDPLGYQAIYYKDKLQNNIENSYRIGASCLTKRLSMLQKGGFCAPMTEEAIRLISDKCRSIRFK